MLIIGLPPLLRELLEAEFQHRGYAVVQSPESLEHLSESVEVTQPDYVVVPLLDAELPQACREFLSARTRVKVIAVEERDGNARLIWLRPATREYENLSPGELITRVESVVPQQASG